FASRRVTIGTTSYATFEDGAELPAIEGWEQSEFDMFQRFSAFGPLYVRSGMGKSTRVLDLLNLRDSVVPGAVALDGFAAAAVDGGHVWWFGRDAEGGARPYAVVADAVAGMEFSTDDLPMPSKPYDAQDVVVADGGTLWVARCAIGRVLISTRTGAGAQA